MILSLVTWVDPKYDRHPLKTYSGDDRGKVKRGSDIGQNAEPVQAGEQGRPPLELLRGQGPASCWVSDLRLLEVERVHFRCFGQSCLQAFVMTAIGNENTHPVLMKLQDKKEARVLSSKCCRHCART